MTYQLRVVPKKKARKNRKNNRLGCGVQGSRVNGHLLNSVMERHIDGVFNTRCADLGALLTATIHAKGEVLFVEGQPALGVFLVRSGRVKLSVSSADGRSWIARRADPGELVGLPAAISGRPHEFTAEALEATECGFIPQDTFVSYLQTDSRAALRMAEILSNMYQATLRQVHYLGLSGCITERMARLLLELPVEIHSNGKSHVVLKLTHKEIAEMVGTSRETVTRVFADLKRKKLVQVNGSGFPLLDRSGLEELLKEYAAF